MRTLIVVVHFSLKMSKYGVSERISIVKAYYSRNNSPIASQRKFATEYELKTASPSVITIKNRFEKFERTGSAEFQKWKFATEYKLKTASPSVITIKNRLEKFERTGSVEPAELFSFSAPSHSH
ncbi:hypothetical protein AVEN_274049-1 [Araneus ventricosus]|uniref:DUF4817 domain-containing protein n=1 Tax=Araneus ventricosus TaxID=182803 RepID=A0A4Y2JPG9_ARAVE|nr:hypothetical protein AVEN_274049-1 [Araneus ventricosus]